MMACGVMALVSLISEIKDRRKSLFISNLIFLWGPIEFISFASLAVFSYIFNSFKFSYTAAFAFVTYFILNIAFAISFEVRIARKDIEYM